MEGIGMKGSRFFVPIGYLILSVFLVAAGIFWTQQPPKCLHEAEIAELRKEYPVYKDYNPEMSPSLYAHQREAVEDTDSVVCVEVLARSNHARPPVRMLGDSQGIFQAGEEFYLVTGTAYIGYTPNFSPGVKLVVPVLADWEHESRELVYARLCSYYVTEDGYLLSVYPDRVFGEEEDFTGRTLEEYWKKCRSWKRFAPEREELG